MKNHKANRPPQAVSRFLFSGKRNRYAALILTMLLVIGLFSGCGNDSPAPAEDKLKIVTTIFPEYDWVCQILGSLADNADVTMLLDNGVDLHSFQPSVDDIIQISACDLFIYTGSSTDSWVDAALAESVNKDMVVIELTEVLGEAVKAEEIVEGMEHDHAHEDEHAHDTHTDDGQAEEHATTGRNDEHIWLSLRNAKTLCAHIAQQLGMLDPENAAVYAENADAYIARLTALDEEYRLAAENAEYDTLLFADRFPFRYLLDDYGLHYYAAFPGCSAESEASFETIAFLSGKADELGLPVILTTEDVSHNLAQTVLQNTQRKDQKILALDSMQSVTAAEIKDGKSYLLVMESNLQVLTDALGRRE
ncbi:MAG: metal ABC transporter substrate-binding protein [Eubacteriales bacterium]|nr:metal ABC transporter substrate-binding protein [Eubacteriales bacterium]